MQLYHLHVPAGFTAGASFFCVCYLGSNKATETREKNVYMRLYTGCDYQALQSKRHKFYVYSILNVIVAELLHNRAITKMASKKWMLGHSEDYVSVFVPCFGAHCHSLSFVIISQPNH